MHKKTFSVGRSTALAMVIGLVGLCGLVGMAQAHPGHAAPDIIHGIELLAAAAPADNGLGQARAVSLWLALLGAVLIALGPLARRTGGAWTGGMQRLSVPVGLVCAGASLVLAAGGV